MFSCPSRYLIPYARSPTLSIPALVYGFGTCRVLLVIKQPLSTNKPTTGWNSNIVPVAQVPNGRFSRIHPFLTQYAIKAAIDRDVGIGVPSKYLLFPVASLGTLATVMLKRARRVKPQRTKNVRKRWSTGVRRPIANAAAAGESPKETCGDCVRYKVMYVTRAPYQICQRIKFLTHHTTLLSPSRDFPIHKVEKQAKRHESQRIPQICMSRSWT